MLKAELQPEKKLYFYHDRISITITLQGEPGKAALDKAFELALREGNRLMELQAQAQTQTITTKAS